jgi:hypothetical protein
MRRAISRMFLLFTLGAMAPAATWAQPLLVWERSVSVTRELEGADQMAVDARGNTVVLGYLPVEQDFYVLKFNRFGRLLWGKLVGGSGIDNPEEVLFDDAGDVYIVGRTLSADFPTLFAYQGSLNGSSDAFLMKLSGDDGQILFSTFFGGSRAEWGRGLALGSDGSIYVTGSTDSTDLPTVDPVQDELNLNQCFCDDVFVTQFTPQADGVLFSTYLGGSFDDLGTEIGLDADGNVHFIGRTTSDDWPTLNAIQPVMGGGEYDLFAARIAPDRTLDYSTFLGGEDRDLPAGMAIDDQGAVYVTGSTRSILFPTTPGAFQENFVGGISACEVPFGPRYNCEDIFVTKINPQGTALVYSTFVGGHAPDEPRNMALDQNGRAHVIGYTYSDDFPLGAPFGTVVTMQLNEDGSDLNYVISHDTPGANAGSALAIKGRNLFIASSVGLPYDTYVARYFVIKRR